ncbi:unnamed protein product, partial [Allacma fusca]
QNICAQMETSNVITFPIWRHLRNSQLKPDSCEDCTLKCHATISPNSVLSKWFEIPIHSCLFRDPRWRYKCDTRFLPGEFFIDLHLWTLDEIAPIVATLYSPLEPMVNLSPRSKQALEAIQSNLSEYGLDIVIPEMETVSEPILQRQTLEKFKCLEVQQDCITDRKSFHYIISTGELIPCCKHCTFSGLNEELQEHVRAIHGSQLQIESSGSELLCIESGPAEEFPTSLNGSNSAQVSKLLASTPINNSATVTLSARCRPIIELVDESRAQGKVWV